MYQIRVDWLRRLESLALGLFEGHEIGRLTIPDALHFQRDVILSVRQGLDAIVEHEHLDVKRAPSTILCLEIIGFMKCMVVSQIVVMMNQCQLIFERLQLIPTSIP